ncbi:PREDICTED: pentatricopeptide repeat-containing protein At5g15300-like [Nelumbo nucifera]|nr:PREDICTED: pentatricopeptide repeat-containing protein At5g15300-like [Nelumbo nucifera]
MAKLIAFSALSTSGSLEHAQAIFEEASMDNYFICNTMIRAYSQSVFPIKAVLLYNQMQCMNVRSDNFTYRFVLRACARVLLRKEDERHDGSVIAQKGAEIHCRALHSGLVCDHFVQNSLIYMYSQCGFLNLARRIFDEMSDRTVASWNIMIAAYNRISDFDSADLLMQSIPVKNVVSWNTLLFRLVKMNDIEGARRLFEEMPEKDAVSWNSLIAGYVQNKDYRGALELFHEMQVNGVEATEVTLISVLGACAETGALEIGRKIHDFLKQKELKIEGFLGNALVDMYAKCGILKFAWEVFNGMRMRHVSCWNSMIVGLAVHGYSVEALELFSAMEKGVDDARPNRVTFIGVLIACSHNGMIEEGHRFFSRMIGKYKIRPDIKHYGCMVDLLSRWGLLEEAHQIIKTMPFDANCVLWRTLLSACRVHGNVELAEEAFRRLADLEFVRDGDYVLMSNIYAEANRWNDVGRLRREMLNQGVLKKPGSSQIEVKQLNTVLN